MADAFCDFENGIQIIVDNNPNCERSFRFEHAIQNVIASKVYGKVFIKRALETTEGVICDEQ